MNDTQLLWAIREIIARVDSQELKVIERVDSQELKVIQRNEAIAQLDGLKTMSGGAIGLIEPMELPDVTTLAMTEIRKLMEDIK